MTTNLCSARKVNACAERGSKYWRFSTTSTCSLKRRRREEYQSFRENRRRNVEILKTLVFNRSPAGLQKATIEQRESKSCLKEMRTHKSVKLTGKVRQLKKEVTFQLARRLIDLTDSVNQRLLTRATSAKFISFMTAPLDRFSVWELTNDSNNVLKAFQ